MENKEETWIKEFDEQFEFDGVTYKGQRHWYSGVKQNLVKSFIRYTLEQALLTQRKELREAIEGLRKTPHNELRESVAEIHNNALDSVLDLLQDTNNTK